jgi:hypothetical protein
MRWKWGIYNIFQNSFCELQELQSAKNTLQLHQKARIRKKDPLSFPPRKDLKVVRKW